MELFQFIKDQQAASAWRDEQDSLWNNEIPVIEYDGSSFSSVQIDGMGDYITFRIDDYPSGKSTHVDHHISEDGYTTTKNAREKVSDNDPNHQLGIYNLERDTFYLVDFSTLPNIRKKPLYLLDYPEFEDANSEEYSDDRNIVMHRLIYSPDGKSNVMDIRSYDNKDRWIVTVNLEEGSLTVLNQQHDEAWIGGPGISSWNMASGTLGWIDNETIYFQSETTGYSHLYALNTRTKKITALTSGNWEVHDATLSTKKDRFYITANKAHAGNRELYLG